MEVKVLSRRCWWSLIFVMAIVCQPGCKGAPTTLDQVIERNTEATGGRAAIEAVQSIAVELHIVDPDFVVDGTYLAKRPGKMRIDIKADGKNVYTEAFDGRRG